MLGRGVFSVGVANLAQTKKGIHPCDHEGMQYLSIG